MSKFINAMDVEASTEMVVGENGTLEYSSKAVGESLVAFFFALVRSLPQDRLTDLFNECQSQAKASPIDAPRIISDLFVLAFQTRDCRGGKGEKSLFYHVLLELYSSFPVTVLSLLPLIAEYGYYKDYFNLLHEISLKEESDSFNPLKNRILDVIVNQLIADGSIVDKYESKVPSTPDAGASATPITSMEEEEGEVKVGTETKKKKQPVVKLSLCAKYCPRESNAFQEKHKEIFRELLNRLFPDESSYVKVKVLYRKLITKLTSYIDIPEVKMCGKRYSSIEFDHVPSLCMNRNRKAFANEKVKGKGISSGNEMETGNRYPEDPDRVACRQHLMKALKEKTIKGKQTQPHEIVSLLMGSRSHSTIDHQVFQNQWDLIKADVVSQMEAKQEGKKGLDLGKLVPMVDVSGSMVGQPMEVAIALGILVSELSHPAFRNHFITFESVPSWVDLSSCATIAEKVKVTQGASWGGSTNIEAAFELIEKAIEKHHLSEDEIPSALIIFSDMQFDEAVGRGQGKTQLKRIQDRFTKLGQRLYGKPLEMPTIIFWNLRGDTNGFPATSDCENVSMLSGFSPSLFKHLLDGSEIIMDEEGQKVNPTPYDTFRKVVDDERYYSIRNILNNSNEGILSQYSFTAPVVVVPVTTEA
jgi:desulfoferrodoxin (superoxide reductase-like protein)